MEEFGSRGRFRDGRDRRDAAGEEGRAGEVMIEEKAPGKSGGVYIPPYKLAQMMRVVVDKSSPQYQRMFGTLFARASMVVSTRSMLQISTALYLSFSLRTRFE